MNLRSNVRRNLEGFQKKKLRRISRRYSCRISGRSPCPFPVGILEGCSGESLKDFQEESLDDSQEKPPEDFQEESLKDLKAWKIPRNVFMGEFF